MKQHELIIIGSGPSGLTAAIYAARADFAPVVFEGSHPGGQLMETTDVENFPGFPDGIMGPKLMSDMRAQAQKFGTETIQKTIDTVDFSDPKNLKLWSGNDLFETKSVIIATGASARWLKLGKGEERFYGKGYTACATCDGAFFRGKIVAVVGGGDSACEEAMFLTKFAEKVYLIHRRDELRASKPMVKRVMDHPKIEILWNKSVTDLFGERVLQSVELTDTVSTQTSNLPLNGLFMGIGHIPNTKIFSEILVTDDAGYLKIEDNVRTSIPSVFVAGDVSDYRYQQAITAAGFGCMAALSAEKYLESLED